MKGGSRSTWLAVGATLAALAPVAIAADDPPRPPSLKTVAVPVPSNLDEIVADRQALVVLGKALFWDVQVGSDGRTACATCHFHAGADSRARNQLDPGTYRVGPDGGGDPDAAFAPGFGPNHLLAAADFPLSPFSNDVAGSQGVARCLFLGLTGRPRERLRPLPSVFRIGGVNVRQSTARHAPSVVNAVFNHRQLWDGRASAIFNGVNGLGDDDPSARVYRAAHPDLPEPVRLRLDDASLASQAVMPVGSAVEMAAEGRDPRHVSRKLVGGHQEVGRRVRESPIRIRDGQALDRGFNNIGVLPTREDLGLGGSNALGMPLSTVRRLEPPSDSPLAVDGAMKVPGLRNVELTRPYFHNGGLLALRDVLRFYSRGGDVRPQYTADGTREIAPLAVLDSTEAGLDALEAFLRSLTDERVRHRRAPFDHPQLFVPDGHEGDAGAVTDDGTGVARDRLREIPAVGRDGGAPLAGFLE